MIIFWRRYVGDDPFMHRGLIEEEHATMDNATLRRTRFLWGLGTPVADWEVGITEKPEET